jgi:hypothetical protein
MEKDKNNQGKTDDHPIPNITDATNVSCVPEMEISSKLKPEEETEIDKNQDKTDYDHPNIPNITDVKNVEIKNLDNTEPEPATSIIKTKSHQQISKLSCEFCFDNFRSERSLRMHKFICDKKKKTAKSKSQHLNDVITAKVQNLKAKANVEVKVDKKIEDDKNLVNRASMVETTACPKDLVQDIIEDLITNVIESQNNNTKKQRSVKRSNTDTTFSRNSYVKRRKKISSSSPTKAETTTTSSESEDDYSDVSDSGVSFTESNCRKCC